MTDEQTTQEPKGGIGKGALVQAIVGQAEFQPGNTAWVFIDPILLAQEEIPVFECDIDDVAVLTQYDLRGDSKTKIEYTVSLSFSLDSLFLREEGELFRTRVEALRFGAKLTEQRANEAESKARKLREIADTMKVT